MKLEIGYHHGFEVRTEHVSHDSAPGFSILFLSDLHLNGFSNSLISNLKEHIQALNPSLILLGGDYVDTTAGLRYFEHLMEFLSRRDNVVAIPGNHDHFFGLRTIREVASTNKVVWLERNSTEINIGGMEILVSNDLTNQHPKQSTFNILLVHDPAELARLDGQSFHLAFAGHLHGCQFVFWETQDGLFPGKFFYRWNVLSTKVGESLCLISKGLGDTLPIRFNCRRDIIFVKVG